MTFKTAKVTKYLQYFYSVVLRKVENFLNSRFTVQASKNSKVTDRIIVIWLGNVQM